MGARMRSSTSSHGRRTQRIVRRPSRFLPLLAANVVVIAAGTLPSTDAVAASECPAPAGAPALAAVDPEVRLQFLARTFDREIADVDLWSWTWGSIYVAAGGAQAVASFVLRDRGVRIDLRVGAISAGIGALALYGLPLQVTLPLRDARRDWSDPDRCRLLLEAEATLETVASRQRVSSSWIPHVGNVLFNAGLVLILGWGYRRWTSAAYSAGIGTAVGEFNVLTQPHRLPGALDRYRTARLDEANATPSWQMALAGGGAGLTWELSF